LILVFCKSSIASLNLSRMSFRPHQNRLRRSGFREPNRREI
jgi:hypothetical protein